MKKVLTITLLITLVFALVPNFTLAADEGYISIVLRPDNFSFTGGVVPGSMWAYNRADANDGVGDENYKLTRYFNNGSYLKFGDTSICPNGTTRRMYVDFYVPTDGEYNIWGIVKTYNGNMEGQRYVQIAVDGEAQSYKYCTNGADSTLGGDTTGWMWEVAPTKILLTEGTHTVDVTGVNANASRFAGLMITNDDSCNPNTMTCEEIALFQDIEKPVFNTGSEILSKVDAETMKATIPEAADNKGINKYDVNISINGNEAQNVSVEGNIHTITGLAEGDSVSVEVKAYDKYGNNATINETSVFTNVELAPIVKTSIVLRPDNFSFTGGVVAGSMWEYDRADALESISDENYQLHRYFNSGSYLKFGDASICPNGTTRRMYVDFYVPVAGEYKIWGIVKTYNGNMEGQRYVQIAVDGEAQSYKYCTNGADSTLGGDTTGWMWEAAPAKVSLTEGIHTIDVTSVAAGLTRFAGLMITNDDSCNPNTMTCEEIALLQDIEKPVFDSTDIQIENHNENSMLVTWTPSNDNKRLLKYVIYVNDTPTELLNDVHSYVVSGLKPLDKFTVWIEAIDDYGNKAMLPKKEAMFNEVYVNNGKFTDKNGTAITTVEAAIEGKTVIEASFELENKSDTSKPILLGIAVYNKETGSMVVSERKELTLSTGEKLSDSVFAEILDEVRCAPESYVIYAAVWNDAESIVPQSPGILIGG